VWVGFDDDTALKDLQGRGITGGRGAAPIWTAFMQRATQGQATRAFTMPPGIHFAEIDPLTGRAPDALTRAPLRVALTESQMADGRVVAIDLGSSPQRPGAKPGLRLSPGSGIVEEDLPPNQ
jgi:penicillin-binding protein 1A